MPDEPPLSTGHNFLSIIIAPRRVLRRDRRRCQGCEAAFRRPHRVKPTMPSCPGYSAGNKEDKEMTAVGEALYLPVPSPDRTPFSMFHLRRPDSRAQEQAEQHRVYRLPRHDSPHLVYTSNGHQRPRQGTGQIIDIYA